MPIEGRGGRTTIWNGVTYPSIRAAARANGISHTQMVNRLNAGYTCDEDVPGVGRPTTAPPQEPEPGGGSDG